MKRALKFNCLLFTFFTASYRNFFSRYLFVLTIFFAGETSRTVALSLASTAENANNLPLALRTYEKK